MPPSPESMTRHQLSAKALDDYRETGLAIVRQLFDPEEVDAVHVAITRIVEDPAAEIMVQQEPAVADGTAEASSPELGVRKLFRMAVHDAFFRRLAHHPGIFALARQILGNRVMLMQSMLLMKPPFLSGEKVWHQDNAYFRLTPADVLGFWVACDDTNVANGCMHVLPASQSQGILEHAGEGDLYGLVSPPDFNDPLVVPVPLQAGDALLFHGEICHGTPPNHTSTRRRALQYHYASARCMSTEREPEVDLTREIDSP